MRVLILTGKFGMGHWAASQALRENLEAAAPHISVTVKDFFEYAMPGASEAVYKFFSLLVTRGSGLYNTYYRATENVAMDTPPFGSRFLYKLTELIGGHRPDVVIATHPLCAQMASQLKRESMRRLPLVTVITDLSAHSEWIAAETDLYFVGSAQVREQLVCKGVLPDSVYVTGIPVRGAFRGHPAARGDGGRKRLLIMGGGLGILPKREEFYAGLSAIPRLHTTVIAGNNRRLYEKLWGLYEAIDVLSYTDHVAEHMAASDLMLSKPGGVTMFEAIFSGLPLLLWESNLQQEVQNAHFAVENGIGRIAPKDYRRCLSLLREMVFDDAALFRMSDNMERVRGELEDACLPEILEGLARRSEVRVL